MRQYNLLCWRTRRFVPADYSFAAWMARAWPNWRAAPDAPKSSINSGWPISLMCDYSRSSSITRLRWMPIPAAWSYGRLRGIWARVWRRKGLRWRWSNVNLAGLSIIPTRLVFSMPAPTISRCSPIMAANRERLAEVENLITMPRRESFMKRLKQEQVQGNNWRDLDALRADLTKFFEIVLPPAPAFRARISNAGRLRTAVARAQNPEASTELTGARELPAPAQTPSPVYNLFRKKLSLVSLSHLKGALDLSVPELVPELVPDLVPESVSVNSTEK